MMTSTFKFKSSDEGRWSQPHSKEHCWKSMMDFSKRCAAVFAVLFLASGYATNIDQIVSGVETAKCSIATATGTTGVLGSLSGCAPPPPGQRESPALSPPASGTPPAAGSQVPNAGQVPAGQPANGPAPLQGPVLSGPTPLGPTAPGISSSGPSSPTGTSPAPGPGSAPQPTALTPSPSSPPLSYAPVPAPEPAGPPVCTDPISQLPSPDPSNNGVGPSLNTPGRSAQTTVGQTFTTPGDCIIRVASVTFALSPQLGSSGNIDVTAFLYKYDLGTNRVIGPSLGSQNVATTEAATTLTATFPTPIQLQEASTYAVILATSGLGQLATFATLNPSATLAPRTIPDGECITLSNGDDSSAIASSAFSRAGVNLQIVIA